MLLVPAGLETQHPTSRKSNTVLGLMRFRRQAPLLSLSGGAPLRGSLQPLLDVASVAWHTPHGPAPELL